MTTRDPTLQDLKPGNILIDEKKCLKISDFGLARKFGSPGRNMSHQAVTRWYRSPELLFGAKKYGEAVDMWSVGCIFAEMLQREPYLQGETDIGQLNIIFSKLGTPTEEEWPEMKERLARMELPIIYSGPYSYSTAPIELVFAALKFGDLNP